MRELSGWAQHRPLGGAHGLLDVVALTVQALLAVNGPLSHQLCLPPRPDADLAESIREHPAEDVYVTGTFDNWSKSEKLVKDGDIFQKTVELEDASSKIYYKVRERLISHGLGSASVPSCHDPSRYPSPTTLRVSYHDASVR